MNDKLRGRNAHSELETLDDLILEKLNPENSSLQWNLENFHRYGKTVKTLKETVKKSIFNEVLLINKEKRILCFIQNYQARLVYLSDAISSYQEEQKPKEQNILEDDYQKLLGLVSCTLVDILIYLNYQFSKYVDQDTKAPIAIMDKARGLFVMRLEEINQIDSSAYNGLLQLILLPVQEFQTVTSEKITTFRRINYLIVILDEVIKVLRAADNIEESLKSRLIYLNFNSFPFFIYITGEIEKIVHWEIGTDAKIRRLSWYLKQIKQVNEKTGFCLKSKQKSIREQVSDWITEELFYLEKYRQIEVHDTVVKQIDGFKIKIGLSVSQLGYLLHLLVEAGVIINDNQRDMIRFLSANVSTHHTETISAESLRAKFYNIEDGTRAAIKSIVIQMLNKINDND